MTLIIKYLKVFLFIFFSFFYKLYFIDFFLFTQSLFIIDLIIKILYLKLFKEEKEFYKKTI
jgi:hypothetical protein